MGFRNLLMANAASELNPVNGSTAIAITGSAAVATLADETIDDNAQYFSWSIENGDGHMRFDGTAPTATVGLLLPDGSNGTMSLSQWRAAKIYLPTGCRFFAEQMQI
jgi:hypothetical protein